MDGEPEHNNNKATKYAGVNTEFQHFNWSDKKVKTKN